MSALRALSALVAVSLIAAPAWGDPVPNDEIAVYAIKKVGNSNVVEVPFDDLNLSQPADVRQLRQRVEVAANQVCAPGLYVPQLTEFRQSECLVSALDGASWQLRRAAKRAREIQLTGRSSIPPIAIAMRVGF